MILGQLLHQMMQRQGGFILGTGHACAGEQVGIPGSVRGYLAQQFVISVRRADENRGDVVAHRCLTEWRRLLNRHVCHQNGVDAHASAFGVKLIDTAVEHQVGVHQQADRNGRVLLANRRQHLEALGRRHAGGECAQRRILDGRAIRQRIGERNTQLQRVGPGFNQGVDNLQRLFRTRIAQGDEGNERAFLAGFQLCKYVIVAFHQISPRAFRIS